jgi:RND family efflux transporter MFP subunit
VSPEAPRGPNLRELESLRIARSAEPDTGRGLLLIALAIVGVAVLAVAGYIGYSRTLGRPLAVDTVVVTATRGAQPGVLLTGSGYVVTRHKYITIGTKILGQIIEEPIEEGQHVNKGDLLARIDDRDYRAQLRQAIADRDLAAANVQFKAAQATRLRTLYESSVTSKDQLDIAENALAVAAAQLKHDEAAIDFAKFNVSQCYITSPINGIVLKKYRELGDTINYGGDIQAGGGATDIVQLADTEDMRAEVDINESDISKVNIKTPAAVIPDAYPDKSFDASLVKIYPEADRQKGTVKVEVQILHPDLTMIKPEMSVKVSFLARMADKTEQALLVAPKKSIVTKGSSRYVWTVRNGVAKFTPVLTGREFESGSEIKQGLSDGDMIIVAPPAGLVDGRRVTPLPASATAAAP